MVSTVEQLRKALEGMSGQRQVLVDFGEDFAEIREAEEIIMEGTEGALILHLEEEPGDIACPFCGAPAAEGSRWCPRCSDAFHKLAASISPLEGAPLTISALERLNWSYDSAEGMVMNLENWLPVGGPMEAQDIAKNQINRLPEGSALHAFGNLWAASPELAILALQVCALDLPAFLDRLIPPTAPEALCDYKELVIYTTLLARQALRLANVAGSGK